MPNNEPRPNDPAYQTNLTSQNAAWLSSSSNAPKYLMVMLHGLGSNGDDLMSLSPFFSEHFSEMYFFSPDGIEPCDMAHYGYQWFSLQDRNPEIILAELENNAPKVMELIHNKARALNIDYSNIFLLGFSQGTMLGLYLSLTTNLPFKAVIGFSGSLFVPSKVNNTKTPICLIHGMEDEVVPFTNMQLASDQLTKLAITHKTHGMANLSHSIDMPGIEHAVNFIKEQINDDDPKK